MSIQYVLIKTTFRIVFSYEWYKFKTNKYFLIVWIIKLQSHVLYVTDGAPPHSFHFIHTHRNSQKPENNKLNNCIFIRESLTQWCGVASLWRIAHIILSEIIIGIVYAKQSPRKFNATRMRSKGKKMKNKLDSYIIFFLMCVRLCVGIFHTVALTFTRSSISICFFVVCLLAGLLGLGTYVRLTG